MDETVAVRSMPPVPSPPNVGADVDRAGVPTAVREVLTDISPPAEVRRLMETAAGFDPVAWERLAGSGLLGLHVPRHLGGSALTYFEVATLFEEAGASLLCAPLFATVALAVNTLLSANDDDAASAYLPGIVAGRTRATVALTEDSGRWDEAGVTTVARPVDDGFVLDGHKSFVVDGHTADLLLVVARSPAGVGLFAVGGDADGLTRTPLVTMDQTRKQARLDLASTPARLVGEDGRGWEAVGRGVHLAATALAAEQVGGARRCLHMAVDHARRRMQFGRPIGSFGAVSHALADVLVGIEAAASTAAWAARAAVTSPGDLAVAASSAKASCSVAYTRAAAANIQVHGGVGFTWDHDAHLYFKRATSSALLLGDPAWHRAAVARHLGL